MQVINKQKFKGPNSGGHSKAEMTRHVTLLAHALKEKKMADSCHVFFPSQVLSSFRPGKAGRGEILVTRLDLFLFAVNRRDREILNLKPV